MSTIVFITGATSGIGKACAELFAGQGCDLILNGRRKERLTELAGIMETRYGVKTMPLSFDVRNQHEVDQAVEGLSPEWKQVDVLVNNAGLALGLAPLPDGDTHDWDTMIDTNVKGLLYVTKAVAPLMRASRKGHIINIGSIAGKEVYPNGGVYCATKHAVDALSKAMRIDLLPHRVKVTAIHPGAAETEFSIVRFKGDTNKAESVYKGFAPLTAEDIAEAVYFAASRPAHVNIDELTIMPSAQAGATRFNREG